ncbi:MAG: NAD(P)H-quinone oxidoreductase subunit 3 [Myxococcota bacterium]|nr:NAD(P)H-quinone oxidoreductase subunit 3 [Myxococcota bacterium]
MPAQYYPMLMIIALAGLIAASMLTLATLMGPYRPSKQKGEPFECGSPSRGSLHQRFSVKFYIVAILFILFDIEIVFIYPWAIQFMSLGMLAFVEMMIFIAVLVAGLAYVWKKGALEWEE